ncbi:23S rRNA (pseudouridine(1915)-N(3))-methyltransferase RlmH [Candidatus Dependentiae bacterium]|nr:23S rRNA (pseudouridine(1915)-N(3))-methyltransferase RlmH [Candidatus Dependentiae bacterium]
MNIKIESFSRIKHSYIKEGISEYQKRLRKILSIQINEHDDQRKITKLISGNEVILLDKGGKHFNSEKFAAWLSGKLNSGAKTLKFIIGPDTGFKNSDLIDGSEKISLSKLTFSGELSAFVLMEQLYRAISIIQKTRYHK